MPRIALSIIVKNEEKNITRCLNSVKSLVDLICITDTGSTDNTLDCIRDWSKINENIQVFLHKTIFENFEKTRNEALLYTFNLLIENVDFVLLLDADMCLKLKDNFSESDKKTILRNSHDSYQVIQFNGSLRYANVRLIRCHKDWRYIGVTHEFIHHPRFLSSTMMDPDCISIDDKNDGGCKSDKYTRDKNLLIAALDQGPHWDLENRYLFYLAQTYMGLGEYQNAINTYKKRIDFDRGWTEELFYSCLQCSLAYDKLADQDAALLMSFYAMTYNQNRAEPYFRILRYFNNKKLYNVALNFGKIGISLAAAQSTSRNEYLFEDTNVIRYYLPIEYSVSLFYTDHHKEFKALSEQLLVKVNANCEKLDLSGIKDTLEKNKIYF